MSDILLNTVLAFEVAPGLPEYGQDTCACGQVLEFLCINSSGLRHTNPIGEFVDTIDFALAKLRKSRGPIQNVLHPLNNISSTFGKDNLQLQDRVQKFVYLCILKKCQVLRDETTEQYSLWCSGRLVVFGKVRVSA